MFSRRLLLATFVSAPLLILSGCGGSTLSAPDPGTRPGLGTLIVKVSAGSAQTYVRIISREFGNSIAKEQDGRAIFYNLSPGRYYIEVSTPHSITPEYDRDRVTVVADRTVTVGASTPDEYDEYVTPTPFFLKKQP